jgi:hypothetical protein
MWDCPPPMRARGLRPLRALAPPKSVLACAQSRARCGRMGGEPIDVPMPFSFAKTQRTRARGGIGALRPHPRNVLARITERRRTSARVAWCIRVIAPRTKYYKTRLRAAARTPLARGSTHARSARCAHLRRRSAATAQVAMRPSHDASRRGSSLSDRSTDCPTLRPTSCIGCPAGPGRTRR